MASTTVLDAAALLLDMDGTLVNSDAVVERCWHRWAALHGLDVHEVLAVAHGRQSRATMALLLPGRSTAEHEADAQALERLERNDLNGVVPVPGAGAFTAQLPGVPHALVTSADLALATTRMAAAGLTLPEVRVTAESVAASKPDPEGFLKGAAELGAEPTECLVFEDSEAGIAAAVAAGMRVVGVGPRAHQHGPTVSVPDLTSVHVTPLDGPGARVTLG